MADQDKLIDRELNKDVANSYAIESNRSICVIPDDQEHRDQLEAALNWQSRRIDARKWPRALQWHTNYAYVVGNHHPGLYWDGSILSGGNVPGDIATNPGSAYNDPVTGAGRGSGLMPPIVDNQTIGPYAANVSRLNAARPEPRVTPASDTASDEETADLASLVLEDSYEQLKMPQYQRVVAEILCLEGLCALEPVYEESDLPTMMPEMRRVPSISNEMLGEELGDDTLLATPEIQPTGRENPVFEEKLQMNVWGAFELDADPKATAKPGSETWFMRSQLVDLGWGLDVFNRDDDGFFPGKLSGIASDTNYVSASPLYWYERVKDLLDTPGQTFGLRGLGESSLGGLGNWETMLRTFTCKPNVYYPHGRTLITLGNKLVYSGDARGWSEKYPERWHRYNIFRYWRIPGRWWGYPLLSSLVPLQKRINVIDELQRINREYMAFGRWLIPKSAKIPDGTLSSGFPGVEVTYNDGPSKQKPEKISNEPFPPELLVERSNLVAEIRQKSGTLSALQGDGGSGIRANSMLDTFNEERFMSTAAMVHDFEEGLEGTFEDILREFSSNEVVADEKMQRRLQFLAAKRDHSAAAVQAFSGKNLRDGIHVKIDIASSMLKSPEAERERAMLLIQYYGQQLEPADFRRLAKVVGEFGIGEVDNAQVRRARLMVNRIEDGRLDVAIPLIGVDDPAVFAAEFSKSYLSDRFGDFPKEVRDAIRQMFGTYQQMLQEQQQKAKQQQIMDTFLLAAAQQGTDPRTAMTQGGDASGPTRIAS